MLAPPSRRIPWPNGWVCAVTASPSLARVGDALRRGIHDATQPTTKAPQGPPLPCGAFTYIVITCAANVSARSLCVTSTTWL